MTDIDPFASASEQRAALDAGESSSRDLLQQQRAWIEQHNPQINALVCFDDDGSLHAALVADEFRARDQSAALRRELLGLPISIKDCIDVAGCVTSAGIPERRDAVATEDAPIVDRLRSAGAVIIGKTNVPPFAADNQANNPLFGRTNNPWDLEYTVGGSSGGSAAAIASGFSALEFGSDLIGSIRQPAAFCGVYGHKPSCGIVPRTGHFPGTPLANPATPIMELGPLARSPSDLHLALRTIVGPDPASALGWGIDLPVSRHQTLKDFRVAFLPLPQWLPIDPEIVGALELLRHDLDRLGLVTTSAAPAGFGDGRTTYQTYLRIVSSIVHAGVPAPLRHDIAQGYRAGAAATDDPFLLAIATGIEASAPEYISWFNDRARAQEQWRTFFKEFDLVIAPVNSVNAFKHLETPIAERVFAIGNRQMPYAWQSFYPGVASFPGLPATAFPLGLSSAGLPIGVQAIGPALEDYSVLQFLALLAKERAGFVVPPMFTEKA